MRKGLMGPVEGKEIDFKARDDQIPSRHPGIGGVLQHEPGVWAMRLHRPAALLAWPQLMAIKA
jgi:hypothetical protein